MNKTWKNLIFLFVTFFIVGSAAYGADYKENSIVIKFSKNFEELESWLNNNRQGEINAFVHVLGHNNSRGYISNSNIILLNKRINNKYLSTLSQSNSLTENISRICIIEYKSGIDPIVAARKISSVPGIEYAEPLYIQHITDIPNDSLVSSQTHLNQIKAFDAWDVLDTNLTTVIGIVDTGVDYLHPDLANNLFINQGENGLDEHGNDKRTNNIDDDSNGFVDDWRGWDFVSSVSDTGDNDPMPGHEHGTHVAGICAAVVNNGIGVAGVDKKVKYLPVKVAPDNPFNTSVTNGFDGITYAAGMGAKVINCSWGSSSKSEAEQEIINAAVSLGSLVVSAAGNDGRNIAFYPSSYDNVLSVTAVDSKDVKANFSNFHNTIDVSAPGVDILSTLPENQYGYLSGTSMATPIVSGIAAMVFEQFPAYKPVQVMQQIKSTTDNIDTLNPYLSGMIGTGRVNAFKALTNSNLKSVLINSYKTQDNNDGIFDRGDTIRLNLTLFNVLKPVNNGLLKLSMNDNNFIILKDSSSFGQMASLEIKDLSDTLEFVVPGNIPADSKVLLEIKMYDDTVFCNSEFIEMTFRPTYRTMNANNITVTFNNIGNIGYNDYPNNNQGDGFKYKDSPNLIFEGALMIGTSVDKLSNVARGLDQIEEDQSFLSNDIFKVIKNGSIAAQEGYSKFYDNNSLFDAGVSVSQSVFQFDDSLNRDFILVIYDIVNKSGNNTDSLFASLFLDWDIGPSGSNNQTEYDNEEVFGYARNVRDTAYPMIGVSMLSSHKLNFYAIDNGGDNLSPGIWDGFPRNEKWMFMSSGILRKESGITDASMVIGAGPIKLKNGDTTRVTFSIFGGKTLGDLRSIARSSREKAISLHLADSTFNHLPKKDTIYILYPNPTEQNTIRADFGLTNSSYIKLEVIDILGKIIETAVPEKYYSAGYYTEFIPVQILSQGRYFLKLTTGYGLIVEPFEVVR